MVEISFWLSFDCSNSWLAATVATYNPNLDLSQQEVLTVWLGHPVFMAIILELGFLFILVNLLHLQTFIFLTNLRMGAKCVVQAALVVGIAE